MSIDTPTKRKSVMNNGIPGAAFLPIPDGLIEAIDRRRLADFYSLGAQVITRNFWVPDRRDVVTAAWVGDQRSSQTWVQDQDASGEWKEEVEVSTE